MKPFKGTQKLAETNKGGVGVTKDENVSWHTHKGGLDGFWEVQEGE